MRSSQLTISTALLAVLGLNACGGSSGSGGGGGSLNLRPVWEQHGSTRALSVTRPAGAPVSVVSGSFGQTIPPAVTTVRIVFAADAGRSCCLAIDPTRLPIDPVTGRGFLLLDQLPIGGATVTLAGFATDFAPAEDGITDACPTDPAGTGAQCDTSRLATPSFESDAQRVTILQGTETNAGDIPVFALPFVLDTSPAPGDVVVNPVSITFTVADAVSGIDGQSITLGTVQNGVPVASGPLTTSACNDAAAAICSPNGRLGLTGFKVVAGAQTFNVGALQVTIGARNLAPTPRTLGFSYQFEVRGAPVGVTPTGSATTPPSSLTPTPTVMPEVVIVRPGGSIAQAAKRVPPGSTVLVAPGIYGSVVLGAGYLQGPISLVADTSGVFTQSGRAPVVISVNGHSPAIEISSQDDVTIDGFTLRGGDDTGVLLTNTARAIVRHCTMTGNRGDGVRVKSSDDTLIFDNLIYNNPRTGIRVNGTNGVRIINNTLYRNAGGGIAMAASDGVALRNNILNQNAPAGIILTPSTTGYDGDYDLNTDGYDGAPVGPHDIAGSQADANPLFFFPSGGDFRLQVGIAGSTSPAFNTGDPDTDADLVAALTQRTTQTDGTLDVPPVDIGYHYPGPPPPTVTPTPTLTPTRTSTPTRTPTRTP